MNTKKTKFNKSHIGIFNIFICILLSFIIVLYSVPFGATAQEDGDLYISSVVLTNRETGTGPWDATDDAGMDSSPDNDIVRSFDTLAYSTQFIIASKDETHTTTDFPVRYQIILDADVTHAKFNTASLKSNFLDTGGTYTIKYYDAQDNLITTGTDALPDYNANEHATGSDAENPYRTEITKQVLEASVNFTSESPVATAYFEMSK